MKSIILNRIRYKVDPLWLGLLYVIVKVFFGKKTANTYKLKLNINLLKSKYLRKSHWDFNGVLLPLIEEKMSYNLYSVYLDTLFVYCNYNENYSSELYDKLESVLPEGPYSYIEGKFKVTVESGDVVIDAGAWIGDFSAYASRKGATVYAFEPAIENQFYLQKTKELGSHISIIPMGIGEKSEISFIEKANHDSVAYKVVNSSDGNDKVSIISLDDFVLNNGVKKLNFIKADIEGAERYLLLGATYVLKTFAPKLAICTYHFPDDPEILSSIILKANPDYTIIQKSKKLYATVLSK